MMMIQDKLEMGTKFILFFLYGFLFCSCYDSFHTLFSDSFDREIHVQIIELGEGKMMMIMIHNGFCSFFYFFFFY